MKRIRFKYWAKTVFNVSMLLMIFFLSTLSLFAQSSSTDSGGDSLKTILIVAAVVALGMGIYGTVKAVNGEAIFYCGIGDYIMSMSFFALVFIVPAFIKTNPIFIVFPLGCALLYNLFMAFNLNSGSKHHQAAIFLGRMTIGYLSLALLVLGLMLIVLALMGPARRKEETDLEYAAKKAGYVALGGGMIGGGTVLIKKLINAQPGDLAPQQRRFMGIGMLSSVLILAAGIGGSYLVDGSRTSVVNTAKTVLSEVPLTQTGQGRQDAASAPVDPGTNETAAVSDAASETPLGIDMDALRPFQGTDDLGKVAGIWYQWHNGENVGVVTHFTEGSPNTFTLKSLDGLEEREFETENLADIKIVANTIEEYNERYLGGQPDMNSVASEAQERDQADGVIGGYPPHVGFINDFANIIDPVSKIKLNAQCRDIEKEKGVQLAVATINSVENFRSGDKTLESFSSNLFNSWGVGDKSRNDGILIIISQDDRMARIELGLGYGKGFNGVAGRVMEEMAPYFSRAAYGEGLVKGIGLIVDQIIVPMQGKSDEEQF